MIKKVEREDLVIVQEYVFKRKISFVEDQEDHSHSCILCRKLIDTEVFVGVSYSDDYERYDSACLSCMITKGYVQDTAEKRELMVKIAQPVSPTQPIPAPTQLDLVTTPVTQKTSGLDQQIQRVVESKPTTEISISTLRAMIDTALEPVIESQRELSLAVNLLIRQTKKKTKKEEADGVQATLEGNDVVLSGEHPDSSGGSPPDQSNTTEVDDTPF